MTSTGVGGGAPGVEARRVAYAALRRVHDADAWSPPAVRQALRASSLDARDRAFAANLAYETLRWEGTLDWALGRVVSRPLARVEAGLLDILRMGAWELLQGAAPDRAAVATAVEVARAEMGPRATGFTNGVLRALARERASLPWPPDDDDTGLALRTGYPEWVAAEARARFGSRARAVLEAGNASPGVTLRAVDGDAASLVDELVAAGLDARPGTHAAEAVRVPGADPGELPAVAQGRATVQDEASMLVVHALVAGALDQRGRLPSGWRAADVCAGPGGKATHLAQLGAAVAAGDLRLGRARLVARAAARLGLGDRVGVVAADGNAPPWRRDAFDGVLVDAPCSGLGVVRRRPELRWRRRPEDLDRLARLQLGLLEAAATLVRPGGTLVYSACTWPRVETVGVVNAFLAAHGDLFRVGDVTGVLNTAADRTDDPGSQLDPDRDDVDAMYVCRLERSDPTGLERSDPTGLERSDPTGLERSDPTGLERSDPTGLERSDPTGLERSDVNGVERSDGDDR